MHLSNKTSTATSEIVAVGDFPYQWDNFPCQWDFMRCEGMRSRTLKLLQPDLGCNTKLLFKQKCI